MGKKPRNKSSSDTPENIISGYNDKNQEVKLTSINTTTKYNKKYKPLVSVCTPTFNRRPFIASMIACFKHQDYPADKMEWIIIDDGTDKIEDLVKDIPQVKYFKYDEKMTLGKKRNLMHEKSSGEILVYMDDDDYYPPQRVSHAVHMLLFHPKALCAGSSEIYIYFKHIEKMYKFGPYGPKHATAGTFAFKRELLKDHKYDESASLAEEKSFLKNYSVPFVQLDPLKVILVFSHEHNTFDKRKLLSNQDEKYCKVSERGVDEFIKEAELKEFYMNKIEGLLKEYEPGHPSNKPDVLKQIKEIEAERARMQQAQEENGSGKIVLNQNGEHVELNNQQVVQILHQQQEQMSKFSKEIELKNKLIQELLKKSKTYADRIEELETNIKDLGISDTR
jgi:glycosyltransferase involved in cell wall biosynthesis